MQKGFVRIIGGAWRGRRLPVPDVKDLRPTPDRVRETLFNWLATKIVDTHCLDLFAGSGVLGFEALSRGARSVVLVDNSREVIKQLETQQKIFNAQSMQIYQATIPQQLQKPEQPFDIVFLDPPYQSDLLLPTCHYLETQGFLSANAMIYLEAKQVITDNDLPANWTMIKSKQAGQVAYHLAVRK